MGRASFSAAGPRLALRGGDRQRVLGKGGVCWHPGDDHGYRGRRGQYSASGRAGAGQLVAAGFGLGASSVLRDSFAMRIDCGDFGERGAFVAISAEDAGDLFADCMDRSVANLPANRSLVLGSLTARRCPRQASPGVRVETSVTRQALVRLLASASDRDARGEAAQYMPRCPLSALLPRDLILGRATGLRSDTRCLIAVRCRRE